jgi:hypothetical protein
MNVKSEVRTCIQWQEALRLRACGALDGEEAARVESHIADCTACQAYAEALRAATAGLRLMAAQPVEPSPRFRARWTQAVEEARPQSLHAIASALAAWWREFVLRNLRPALALAPLWVLALLFWISAPETTAVSQTAAAQSPVRIARALGGQHALLAWRSWKWDSRPVAAPHPSLSHPRTQTSPEQPSAKSGREGVTQPAFELAAYDLSPQSVDAALTHLWTI